MGCFSAKAGKESDEERSRREANKRIEKQLQKDKQTYRATHRLLLLGKCYGNIVALGCTGALQISVRTVGSGHCKRTETGSKRVNRVTPYRVCDRVRDRD